MKISTQCSGSDYFHSFFNEPGLNAPRCWMFYYTMFYKRLCNDGAERESEWSSVLLRHFASSVAKTRRRSRVAFDLELFQFERRREKYSALVSWTRIDFEVWKLSYRLRDLESVEGVDSVEWFKKIIHVTSQISAVESAFAENSVF